ncbi:hypothetical protein Trydic_g96 [Trypoxylus dichotomus]
MVFDSGRPAARQRAGTLSRGYSGTRANSRSTSGKSKFYDKRKPLNESEFSSSDAITNTAQSKEEDKNESLDYVEERIKEVRECVKMRDDKSQSLRPLVALSEFTARIEDIGRGSSRKHKRKKRPKTAKANITKTEYIKVTWRPRESFLYVTVVVDVTAPPYVSSG